MTEEEKRKKEEEERKKQIIFKTFRPEVIKVAADEEGVIDMLIPMSTGSVDRHGESIDPKGWRKHLKIYKKRAILISSHNYSGLTNQIGEVLDVQIVEKGLLARPKYYINQGNPEADWGYFLATKGKAAYSVGFIPYKWVDSKEDPRRTYTEQELVEISHIIVPSNRDAIQEYKQKSDYAEEDPIIKEVIEEVLNDDEMVDFYDSRLILPYKEDRELLLEWVQKDIITKPEETEKYIRIPAKGEEGKHKGHKIRTMTVSSKEGIKGIYCIDCKKIITFLFDKKKGWTMAKAKKWMEDHGKMVENYFLNIDPNSFKDLEAKEIDWEKVEADILKEELKDYPKFKYFDEEGNEVEIEDEGDKDYEAMAGRFCEKYLTYRKLFEDSEKKIKDIELKAGAVLNAKNKKDLKTAQVLIQSVLDSTGKEEGQEGEGKDSKKDDTVIIIIDDKKGDPPKDEKKDKDLIEVDEKLVAEIIEKKMNYLVGKTDK